MAGANLIRPRSKDPRANGAIFADGCRREVISRFEKLLTKDFDNRARLSLLWSDGDKESGRGTGKTALLRHFQHRINHDWGQSEFRGFNAAVIYVAFPDQVDRLYSEQLAWAALVDAHESGLIRAAAASIRIPVVEKRWPDAAKKIIADIEQHEKEGKEWYGLLFSNDYLSEFGVDGDELGRIVIEDLVDADVDEEHVLRSQLRRRVHHAILALPAIYRALVMLRDIQGMLTEEASAMLRVKYQTLKSRLHRGRLILRSQLADFAGGLTLHRPIYGT